MAPKRPRDEHDRRGVTSEIGDFKAGIMSFLDGALGKLESRLGERVDKAVLGICERVDDQNKLLQDAISDGTSR